MLGKEAWRREKLFENIALFRRLAEEKSVSLLPSETPIQSVVLASPEEAVRASGQLEENGLLVVAIRPPTVPEGTSRLRITISAAHEAEQIKRLVNKLAGSIQARSASE